jgi:hypothetical protein
MATRTEPTSAPASISSPKGQRLQCQKCGSEIEIINPCTCNPPDQQFRCCGEDMVPTSTGNMNVGTP